MKFLAKIFYQWMSISEEFLLTHGVKEILELNFETANFSELDCKNTTINPCLFYPSNPCIESIPSIQTVEKNLKSDEVLDQHIEDEGTSSDVDYYSPELQLDDDQRIKSRKSLKRKKKNRWTAVIFLFFRNYWTHLA